MPDQSINRKRNKTLITKVSTTMHSKPLSSKKFSEDTSLENSFITLECANRNSKLQHKKTNSSDKNQKSMEKYKQQKRNSINRKWLKANSTLQLKICTISVQPKASQESTTLHSHCKSQQSSRDQSKITSKQHSSKVTDGDHQIKILS